MIIYYWTYKIGPSPKGIPSNSPSIATSADGLAFKVHGKASPEEMLTQVKSKSGYKTKFKIFHCVSNLLK